MHDSLISQLQSSILLGSLSLIPNDMLRYTLLVIAAGLALVYVVHLKRPSTQLRYLEDILQKTEEILRDAKLYCPMDLLSLVDKRVRLLESSSTIRFMFTAYLLHRIKCSASMIQCRLLETNTLTWKKHRLLSHDISVLTNKVKEIQTAVQLIVEAERQHKYTDDINETESIFQASVRAGPGSGFLVSPDNVYNRHQQSYMLVLEDPSRLLADTGA
ncbi:hypothetical protein FB451DRAFT_1466540 [Mycena latifolia]|nr:hypothetical protein FB451DRAFT_1466540 [Mycena latifolia]